ncbi:MAG: oligosaccharide repeat unit polymerase [Pyrinomonadaceae bacterium]|nr:oligosaccharide repeat unit polymerase [Sphingobacteriaceae bacterium]
MKRYFQIDHRILFLFGYLFYFLTPYIVGTTHAFQGYPGMEIFHGYFKKIPEDKLSSYFLITLTWFPAFYAGHFCFKLIKPYKKSLKLFPSSYESEKIWLIALVLLFVFVIFAFNARHSFGVDDYFKTYDGAARGKISTLMVTFNFLLLYQLLSKQTLSITLVIGTICTALLLLALGGRMYVIQTFLIILVYKTSFAVNRWKIYQIALVLLIGFLIGASVGVLRMKSSVSFDKVQYSLLAEPVFTWFSTSTFLIYNEIPLINFPTNFLTSFLNLVPNSIFSLKQYVVSVKGMGFYYVNPLGADSIWSTIVINFGSVGAFFFIFITGFLLNFLRHLSEDHKFWAVYYILVCSILPFQIFRDGFFIINKQLFFNFMLFPIIILGTLKFIEHTQKRPEKLNETDKYDIH